MNLIAALIRHGDYHQLPDTPSAHQPFPLNARGEQQAHAALPPLREALERYQCTVCRTIDTSSLLRAWQTAWILRDGLAGAGIASLELQETPALTERCVGSVANLSTMQIEEIVHADPRYAALPAGWKSDADFRLPFPGAESLRDAGARVADHLHAAMTSLRATGADNQIKLFVGHGGSFRHAAMHLGVLSPEEVPGLSMYHVTPVYLAFAAGGKWRHIGGEWKIRAKGEAHRD